VLFISRKPALRTRSIFPGRSTRYAHSPGGARPGGFLINTENGYGINSSDDDAELLWELETMNIVAGCDR
jgi:hypothetical protein